MTGTIVLFVTQRVNGMKLRCTQRWINAKEKSNEGTEPNRQDDGLDGDDRTQLIGQAGQSLGANKAEQHTDDATDQAEYHRLDQELQEDVTPLGAHSLAQADLPRSLGMKLTVCSPVVLRR